MESIRVLIVDDSLFFRNRLERVLSAKLPEGTTFRLSSDAHDAADKIISFNPDVMILDADMPGMDGIRFLRKLMGQYAQPTIVLGKKRIQRTHALSAGAMDFMVKPEKGMSETEFHSELARRVAGIAGIDLESSRKPGRKIHLIAIGASTGGTDAISSLLKGLKPQLPPIVIVQHIPPKFSKLFAESLDQECTLNVKEAEDGDTLMNNSVYVAPGKYQMRVHRIGGLIQVSCTKEPKVGGHCPSVNVLFDSVANQFGENSLGVILTGMGSDGSKGLLNMRNAGAITLGQDETSSAVYGMPKAAYNMGAVERQLPLSGMAEAIMSIACGKR